MLQSCRICNGAPEYYTEYVETTVGDRKCVAVRCTQCRARTALCMCDDADMAQIYKDIDDLWNRGRIGNVLSLEYED